MSSWLEIAAFDLLLLSDRVDGRRIDAGINSLGSRFPDMTTALGFESCPTYERRQNSVGRS